MLSKAFPTSRRLTIACFLCLSLTAAPTQAQNPPPAPTQQTQTAPQQTPPTPQQASTTPAAEPEEVIRVSTELVQTDVMVFDRQGRFVEGLQREQFELKVDGRAQEIGFFEQVRAGTANEDAQLAAARGRAGGGESGARPLDRGRTIFFFVDDLHLSAGSFMRARQTVLRFIDSEMGQNDQVAVTSATGQIGFLQQLTDNKAVLRAAVSRLGAPPARFASGERPLMSEYQALMIESNDRSVFNAFVEATIQANYATLPPALARRLAENEVRGRARQMVEQSSAVAFNTLQALESLMRSAAQLPGRKLVFFLSEGFYIASNSALISDWLRRITDAGARSGVVIYALDARGLATDPGLDASRESFFDPTNALAGSSGRELSAAQEALHTLAVDTGGRALLTSNDLNAAITRTINETSVYYLLAWTPEREEQRGRRFQRIEVNVRGRPELNVQVRRGYFNETPPPPNVARNRNQRGTERDAAAASDELLLAFSSLFPRTAIPMHVAAGYESNANSGIIVTANSQLASDALQYAPDGNAQSAIIEVVSALLNDRGQSIGSFRNRLSIAPPASAAGARQRDVVYSHQFRVPTPGLYQVRIAARDTRSGRVGSAAQWLEIPNLTGGGFALSSLFLGERIADGESSSAAAPEILVNADRRFARSSRLRFQTAIYNAARSAAPPDVALQVQIFRDDQPVITTPLSRVNTAGVADMARIPYAAEIRLSDLPVGRYVLQVTAIDRAARASAAQRISFDLY